MCASAYFELPSYASGCILSARSIGWGKDLTVRTCGPGSERIATLSLCDAVDLYMSWRQHVSLQIHKLAASLRSQVDFRPRVGVSAGKYDGPNIYLSTLSKIFI